MVTPAEARAERTARVHVAEALAYRHRKAV